MHRQAPVQTVASFEAFLEFEETARERHEFIDGNLFVMAGGTSKHDHVGNALRAHLFFAAQKGGFRLYGSDMLIQTPDEIGYYPDAFVVLDPADNHPRVKRSPAVIIEVLSESTEAIDRGEKLRNYRKIPSLEQYVLLSQNEALGDMLIKQNNGSWNHQILEANAVLEIPCIEFSLPLAVLYENLPAE